MSPGKFHRFQQTVVAGGQAGEALRDFQREVVR